MDTFDFDGGDLPETPASPAPSVANTGMANHGTSTGTGGAAYAGQQEGGSYANELASETIQAKFRTFYIDLKESGNGRFVKVSEKSRGRKTTIMMDEEDVAPFIEALQRIQAKM